MDINQMTREEMESLPHREWNEEMEFSSMIILPGYLHDLHDSGFRCMDFVAVENLEPLCLLAGGSDVIHIDGIGGFGAGWGRLYGAVPTSVPASGWSIDCLTKSGLLRIWPSSGRMKCGPALSSFEIYALPTPGATE